MNIHGRTQNHIIDFIGYIFASNETIEIRLHIDGYMLCGYIYM